MVVAQVINGNPRHEEKGRGNRCLWYAASTVHDFMRKPDQKLVHTLELLQTQSLFYPPQLRFLFPLRGGGNDAFP